MFIRLSIHLLRGTGGFLISGLLIGVKIKSLFIFKSFTVLDVLAVIHFVWERNSSQLVLAFEMISSLCTFRHTSLVKSMNAAFEDSLFLRQAMAALRTCSVICILLSRHS